MSYQAALDLQADAVAALADAGVDDVLVTLDGEEAPGHLAMGASVVLITPPATEFTGAAVAVATWTVYAIAATAHDPAAWWPALDSLSDALALPLEVDRQAPIQWRTNQGATYPAVQLTLTT